MNFYRNLDHLDHQKSLSAIIQRHTSAQCDLALLTGEQQTESTVTTQ